MKLIKYLFFLLLIVLVGGAIYFGTKDGSFDVSESKMIAAPSEVIYNEVKDYRNWEAWGPWMEEDPDIELNYAEKTAGEGASYSWKSEIMGDGSMKTVKVIPNKEIDQQIVFNSPMGESKSEVYWRFSETDTPGQTEVIWGMRGEQSFMEKVFMGLFSDDDMETAISDMYEKGLTKLDSVVVKSMNEYTVSVDGITQYGGGYYMFNTTSSKVNEIGSKMEPMMGQVAGFMIDNNIPSSGMPFTIYNEIDQQNGTVIFSAAIPVKERVITPEGSPVLCGFMEPVTTLKTTLKGKYEYLPKAYEAAQIYLQQNNLTPLETANMFEVYATDPGEVPNPSDWVTEVYIPIVTPVEPQQ
jgi:effector-binding domain-containing protein